VTGVEQLARAGATRAVRRLLPDEVRRGLRFRLVANRVTRRLYDDWRELDMVESRLRRGPSEADVTVGMTERVVEIPWVLSRYRGERRVLDIGPAFAQPLYVQHLTRLGIPELHGVDLAPVGVPGMRMTRADVRQMPFADWSFDLITCVSTLEHIGRDNAHYLVQAPTDVVEGDLATLRELRRVLGASGRILITVPFGRLDIQDWQKQYDLTAWRSLLERAALQAVETEFFGYTPVGWRRVADPAALAGSGYRADGAPGATGVCCAALTRSDG
jgi:O-antigen chain-terminating methyltransferase